MSTPWLIGLLLLIFECVLSPMRSHTGQSHRLPSRRAKNETRRLHSNMRPLVLGIEFRANIHLVHQVSKICCAYSSYSRTLIFTVRHTIAVFSTVRSLPNLLSN
ncbi:hypothetical protein DM01DRAFT_316409 [Hesseltinella vesiculosa]|uniref:Secreted protein n=1 Tax=Hesseltinella vesiculosa TaxID=101127 RepID=A0A1X2G630_9FUNG|nr:hypothetical protein DM01DRAFT_316409 [Hesseltinella vesiculosa]